MAVQTVTAAMQRKQEKMPISQSFSGGGMIAYHIDAA